MYFTSSWNENSLRTKITVPLTCRHSLAHHLQKSSFSFSCHDVFPPKDCLPPLCPFKHSASILHSPIPSPPPPPFAASSSSLAGCLHHKVSPRQRRMGSPPLELRWLSSCRASLWAGLDKHPRELPSWRLFTAGSERRRLDGHRRGGGGENRAPLIYQPVSEWLTLASKRGCWSHSQYLPNRTVTGAITSLWPFVMREARLEKASLSLPGWQAHPCSPLGVLFLCNFYIPPSGWSPYDDEQCQNFYRALWWGTNLSYHSNPKERQCQRMFKLPYNCTHFTLAR